MRFRSLINFCLFTAGIAVGQAESVVIVYTHNTNGVLENCNCPVRSYGAIEKRAVIIDSVRRAEKNVLLVDAGDILDISQSTLLHNYIIRAYSYMQYDYWTAGDQDFIEGPDFFIQKMYKPVGQLLATNIEYRDKPLGSAYAIHRFGDLRIGITATISSDLLKYLDKETKADFNFREQIPDLVPVIELLVHESDYIILLSHSGINRDEEIALRFPEIGLIIGGHSQTLLVEPEICGNTLITQIGESGYRVGILKLQFKNRKLSVYDNHIILLTKGMADDPQVKAMITQYHRERLKR
jgi:2',3'-cyclic-nucleotide 2'-phosphodiesterase (5'-nucleotidase family)